MHRLQREVDEQGLVFARVCRSPLRGGGLGRGESRREGLFPGPEDFEARLVDLFGSLAGERVKREKKREEESGEGEGA